MRKTLKEVQGIFLTLFLFFAFTPLWAKYQPTFAISDAASQPYPYNGFTWSGRYQANLLSNVSLDWFTFRDLVFTFGVGTDILDWDKSQWVEDPATNTILPNVFLSTVHYMGGIKFFPWGEVIDDDFWRLGPYVTVEGGILDFQAIGLTDNMLYDSEEVPMLGIGIGFEVGIPGENDELEILRLMSRHLRFFMGLKYFYGFTVNPLQYFPLQFGLKIRI